MVIQTPQLLLASGSGTDSLSYTTAQISPDAGALLVLFVDNGAPVAGENDVPTITDSLGFSWTLRDTSPSYVGTGGSFFRGSFFTAEVPTGGDSGAITISFAHLQSNCHWHLIQVKGAKNSDPVVQAGHAIFSTTTNPSVVLAADPLPTSLVLGAAVRNSTTPYTAGAGHTILSSVAGNSSPTVGSDVSYDMAPASKTVAFTTSSGAQKNVHAIEIAMGGEVAPPPTPAEATLIRKWKQSEITADNIFELVTPAALQVGETLVISMNRVTGATAVAVTGVTGIGTNVANLAASGTRASTMIVDVIVIPITQVIPSGTTISIGITSGSPSRKVAVCSVWSGLTGAVGASSGNVIGSGPNGSSAVASAVTTGSVTSVPALIISTYGHGAAVTATPLTSTVVDTIATAAGSTDRAVTQAYRKDTDAGVKTVTGNLSASGGWAAAVIALPLASASVSAPIANAGGDQLDVEPGYPIHLDAGASTAAGAMTFVWNQISGEPVDFTTSGATLDIAEAPWTVGGTTLKFRVSVTSGGVTTTDDVQIFVLPATDRIKINGAEVALKIIPA